MVQTVIEEQNQPQNVNHIYILKMSGGEESMHSGPFSVSLAQNKKQTSEILPLIRLTFWNLGMRVVFP